MKGVTFNAIVIIGALVLITSLVLISGSGEGATITVDDDGGADYERIQDAINNAIEGDTIRVYAGEYSVSGTKLEVGKSLDLVGNGSGTTIILGEISSDILEVTADEVTIQGFHFEGAPGYNVEGCIRIHSHENNIHT